jgi:predicted GNAT family acetyltransferase
MTTSKHQEELLDEALEETFPASDVPRVFEPGPPGDDELVVRHEDRDGKGAFFIEVDGTRAGEMVYRRDAAGHVVIQHTEVGDRLRGRGAGKRLLEEAVRWARASELRIVPQCPFARATFAKHPELGDVLLHP